RRLALRTPFRAFAARTRSALLLLFARLLGRAAPLRAALRAAILLPALRAFGRLLLLFAAGRARGHVLARATAWQPAATGTGLEGGARVDPVGLGGCALRGH